MEIWQLFGGLIITLIIASSIGYGLKFKVGFSTPHAVIDNLNARINAWWVMILIIFAAARGIGFLWRDRVIFCHFFHGIA